LPYVVIQQVIQYTPVTHVTDAKTTPCCSASSHSTGSTDGKNASTGM